MRYLAIDYGSARIGLAICDPGEVIVSPLGQIDLKKGRPLAGMEDICRFIAEYKVDALVVGLPLNMDDSEGPQAQATRRFAQQLEKVVTIPIHFQDERLSSAGADEWMDQAQVSRSQRKQKRDMLAACHILQDFLDQRPKPS